MLCHQYTLFMLYKVNIFVIDEWSFTSPFEEPGICWLVSHTFITDNSIKYHRSFKFGRYKVREEIIPIDFQVIRIPCMLGKAACKNVLHISRYTPLPILLVMLYLVVNREWIWQHLVFLQILVTCSHHQQMRIACNIYCRRMLVLYLNSPWSKMCWYCGNTVAELLQRCVIL